MNVKEIWKNLNEHKELNVSVQDYIAITESHKVKCSLNNNQKKIVNMLLFLYDEASLESDTYKIQMLTEIIDELLKLHETEKIKIRL